MKLDKKTLDKLSALPDDSLWQLIVAIANSSGIDLSKVKVRPEEMSKLRYAMGTLTDDDIGRASEILSSAKKQGKRELNG